MLLFRFLQAGRCGVGVRAAAARDGAELGQGQAHPRQGHPRNLDQAKMGVLDGAWGRCWADGGGVVNWRDPLPVASREMMMGSRKPL